MIKTQFKIVSYGENSVVYNINSGDLHLLTLVNAELLRLMVDNIEAGQLIDKIVAEYAVSRQEASRYLKTLYHDYQALNLLN